MVTVGFVVHPDRAQAGALADAARAWLAGHGHRAVVLDAGGATLAPTEDGTFDLAVSVGGDGTMLRTVGLVAAAGVPILGVNVGQLGYLSEVEPPEMLDALERILAGDHRVESRMLLSVEVVRADGTAGPTLLALNEAVLEKTPMGHTVRLGVHVDDERFTTYAADGLIVATPTGSTAYALSARGPIVAPTHRAMLLTPVSPHMLFDRTLVLEPDNRLRLTVEGHRPATLHVDGRTVATLVEGDSLLATAASTSARLVTFADRDFLHILKAKFGLNDR